MPQDKFDKAFSNRFGEIVSPDAGNDFDIAFQNMEQRIVDENKPQEFGTLAGDVPPLSAGAEQFFNQEETPLAETPLTPDQEFSEIISPDQPKDKKPSFFNRVKESFLKAQGALARTKTKPIKKLGTFLRKAAQQPVGPGGMTAESAIGVVETGLGREVLRRKVSQSGDMIKKHREGKLEAKDIIDFFRPDKNLKDFWQELQKINRDGAVFGVTLDDKQVPKELQFRSFVTEFNKLAFEDMGLPPDVEIPLTPLKFDGPTVKLKTLATIAGFTAEVLDPSIFGVGLIGSIGKASKVKDIIDVKKALETGTELTEKQTKIIKELDQVSEIAIREQAETDLIKEIEGFGAEAPSGQALEVEKPGPFKRVQADEIPEPEVSSLAARIARGEEGFGAKELEIQTNFPDELETELSTLRKGEDLAPEEPLPTLTRDDVEKQVRGLGFSEEQADAQLKLFEARAKAWARQTGRDAGEWYGERIAGIKRSVQAELNKEEALFQDFQSGDNQIEIVDKDGADLFNLSGDYISTNSDGTVTLFHRTHPKAAERIRETGKFISKEQGEVFFSTNEKGQAVGFGDEIISVRVNPNKIRIDDAFGDEIHVAINSNDIGKENLIDSDVLFQKPQEMIQDSNPVFYSTLRNTIEDKMPGRADVATVRGLVKNIKKEEMQWSGLDDYLASREGDKITKDDVLDFLKENQIRIEETLKGTREIRREDSEQVIEIIEKYDRDLALEMNGNLDEGLTVSFTDDISRFLNNSNISQIEEDILTQILDDNVQSLNVTRHGGGEFQLPGGENYKEMLLRLPVKETKSLFRIKRVGTNRFGIFDIEKNEFTGLDFSSLREANDNLITQNRFSGGPTPELFRSSHWDEPNILSHVRFNERMIVNPERFSVDEKVLFIEEIQSDWMQAGRKRGFKGTTNQTAINELTTKKGEFILEHRTVADKLNSIGIDTQLGGEGGVMTGFTKKRNEKVESFANGTLYRIKNLDTNTSSPNQTFKSRAEANRALERRRNQTIAVVEGGGETSRVGKISWSGEVTDEQRQLIKDYSDSVKGEHGVTVEADLLRRRDATGVPNAPFKSTWHEMSMRRMIRYAADNNFDRIGWTTGAQQADRYDLSKQVDEIDAFDNLDGTYEIHVAKDHQTIIEEKNISPQRIEDLVGKELAEKIIKDAESKRTTFKDGDENLIKTYSGLDLKVGGEGMKTFYDKILVNYANKFGKKWGSKVEDVEINLSKNKSVEGRNTIHSMKITPEMKQSVRENGVPLFQDAKGAVEFLEGEQRAVIHMFESSDFSTILHETGHIFRRELTGGDLAKAEKWAGAREGNWTTEAEEKFARGFERWLREGEAPNSDLEKIFEQFKEWLTEIYRVIKGGDLDVRLNEDIRQVFDNLLGGKELGDFTGRVSRQPAGLPEELRSFIGDEGIRLRPNTDFFRGELREEIKELKSVLQKKFPFKKIFVTEGGQTLDELAQIAGQTEDEFRLDLLKIGTKKEELETLRVQAEEAFQTTVTVNSKGELVVDGSVLFQKQEDLFRPKPTAVKGGKPQERLDLKVQAQVPKGKIKTKPIKTEGTLFEGKVKGSQTTLFQRVFKKTLFQEAPGLSPGQRKKSIGKLKIEKFSEEAKGVIEESIKVFGKDIRAQRRGKRSIAVTKQAATQQKQLILDALNGKVKPGTAFNAEELHALGAAVDEVGAKLAKDTKLMENPVTMHLFTNLFKAFSGAATETGRGFRQLREVRAGHDFDVFRIIKKKAVELDAEISNIIDKEVPSPSLMNKIVEFSRNVKLMSASSLVRSFVGNLSMQAFKFAETGISPVYNKILSALTGKSQDRFIREFAADFMGMKAGISEGLQSARGILVENSDALAESAFLQREFGKTMRAISGPKGKVIRIGQNAQGAIDAIFRVPAIEGRIRVHAWRQALQENLTGSDLYKRVDELIEDIPSDKKLMDRILEEARQQTFQKELGSIGRGINAARQGEGGALQLIVPFFNTAANLFKEFVARTPLALVTKSFWMDASKMWKPGEIGLASDALAKITTGTLFSVTVYVAVNEIMEGRIIGRGPSSQNERNLLRESGWQPYSVRVGDKYYSYMGFEPMSSFLGALADFYEGKKEKGLIAGFSKAFENVAATFADNPFLQGISDTADLLQGRKNLNQYLTQLAVGMVMPSIVRQTAKVIDPTMKVKRDGSLPENIRDGFVAVTPWLSKNLEARYSPLGKKIVRQNALGNLFAIKISKESNDLVVKELAAIGFFPGSGSRFQNINLTEKEKNNLNEIAGKQLYKSVLQLLSNPEWKTLDKADKVKVVRRIKNKIFDVQKSMLFGESGELLAKNPINKNLTSAQLKLKKNQLLLSKR